MISFSLSPPLSPARYSELISLSLSNTNTRKASGKYVNLIDEGAYAKTPTIFWRSFNLMQMGEMHLTCEGQTRYFLHQKQLVLFMGLCVIRQSVMEKQHSDLGGRYRVTHMVD